MLEDGAVDQVSLEVEQVNGRLRYGNRVPVALLLDDPIESRVAQGDDLRINRVSVFVFLGLFLPDIGLVLGNVGLLLGAQAIIVATRRVAIPNKAVNA